MNAARPPDGVVWGDLPLTAAHAEYLERGAAITAAVAAATGIFSVTNAEEIPAGFTSYGEAVVPSIAFLYRSPLGGEAIQLRPDTPVTIDGQPRKYLWVADTPLMLNAARRVEDATTLLIVEGTKQALAAAGYAPEHTDVVGMVGCRGWYRDHVPTPELAVCEDRHVVIVLDADASTNLDVYTAGVDLAAACAAEGARSTKFVRLVGGRKAGLDDVLAKQPADRRAAYLTRLIASAKSKPADRMPKPPPAKQRDVGPVASVDRGIVVVNGDRHQVIEDLTQSLLDRHDADRLFCYGGVVAQRKKAALTPVTKDAFGGIIASTAITVVSNGEGGRERFVHAWPDGQTMGAILADAERFSVLDKLSQTPFVRPDGTVCQTPGYDPTTKTFLVLDPGLEMVDVPAEPTPEEVSAAVKLLTVEWLGDFPFPTDSDRANAIGLVLTSFIRGLVALVPLAVVDGKEAGSGKNLLADVVAILITGKPAQPLPYTTDDAEQRKVITSAFRSGAELFIFDEAHSLDGPSFARALTSITYQDRVLGVSNLAEFPNRVTWISLGNQVQVFGDMGRRVYRIALAFDGESPENRPASSFRHADLREWTEKHRAELLGACLTLIRAWFAAGQPVPKLPFAMGSFEGWQKVIAGILETAGVDGFLTNVKEWRSESDFDRQHWVSHLAWLYETFGDKRFTAGQVGEKLDRAGRSAEPPPKLEDPTVKGYPRLLGQAYARVANRVIDGYRLSKSGRAHGNGVKWVISSESPGGNGGNGGVNPGMPDPPVFDEEAPDGWGNDADRREGGGNEMPTQAEVRATPPYSTDTSGGNGGNGGNENLPLSPEKTENGFEGVETGGKGGNGGNPLPFTCEKKSVFLGADAKHVFFHVWGGGEVAPVTPLPPKIEETPSEATFSQATGLVGDEEGSGGNAQGAVEPGRNGRNSVIAEILPVYEAVDLSTWSQPGFIDLPEGVITFDIESDSVRKVWTTGPEFVRITGYQKGDTVRVTDDFDVVAAELEQARVIVGHNLMGFDILPLALHRGFDIHRMAEDGRLYDTQLTEVLLNPPTDDIPPRAVPKKYGLDALAEAKFGTGKDGDLKALVKEFGGDPQKDEFAVIPVDDERYVRYCATDVSLTARIARGQRRTPSQAEYIRREHRIAAIAAQIRINGFRVDEPELRRRAEVNRARKKELAAELISEYGLPTTRKDGKTPTANPAGTEEGKLKLDEAFTALGVTLPRSPSGDLPSTSKETMIALANEYRNRPDILHLVDKVQALNGVRSVYDTALENLHPDGRVHPEIAMYQASGRWSTTKPGLTVFGKRGGRHVEREIFLPEPGHVIISADLSQVDARAIAAWCQDPAYLGLFEEGQEFDSHQLVAMAIWNDVNRREDAKACGHGYNYGLGFAKLAKTAGSAEVAAQFMRSMEQQFPLLAQWKDQVRREAVDNGHVLDNGWGRTLRITPGREYTQAPALMGQSAARDIMMEGLLRIPRELYIFLRAQVHDEIVMSVPEDRAAEIEATVVEALSFPWSPFNGTRGHVRQVQIEAGVGKRGESWGACYASK